MMGSPSEVPPAMDTSPTGPSFADPIYYEPTGSAASPTTPDMSDTTAMPPLPSMEAEPSMSHEAVHASTMGSATAPEHYVSPVDAHDFSAEEAKINPVTAPAFTQAAGGACVIKGKCIETPNYDHYPALYNTHEHCDISVMMPGTLDVECDQFHTELHYDQLKIDGVTYEGQKNDPHYSRRRTNMTRRRRRNPTENFNGHFKCPNGVKVSTTSKITWNSDYSVTKAGWKLCLHHETVGAGVNSDGATQA